MKNIRKIALERAKRLHSLRKMVDLSRAAFAKKIGVPASNFQNWEGPRYGGLTEKGAEILIAACWKEGLEVSIEWLMYGVGFPPVFLYTNDPKAVKNGSKSYGADNKGDCTIHGARHYSIELAKASRELEVFRKHYGHEVLDFVIFDKSIEPRYKIGDWLAGKRFLDPNPFVGCECIVETAEKQKLLRVLRSGSRYGTFNLESLSATQESTTVLERDVEVLSIAPIMWLRRVGAKEERAS